jgi:hypothetical protein
MWSWGGKKRRIWVSEMGREGYALSRHVAISFLFVSIRHNWKWKSQKRNQGTMGGKYVHDKE